MRAIAASIVVSVVIVLTADLAGAQPTFTPCVLTGDYVLTAALAFSGEAQLSGQFTFTPGLCTASAFGNVQLALSVLVAGSPTPTPFAATLPYTVDATGRLSIGPGIFQGAVGGVADTGIAQSVVFEADPAINPATVRLAGTAVRTSASNTIGSNTVVGSGALAKFDYTAAFASNTAVGRAALGSDTTGNSNTAVGDQALQSNITGSGNIAVGRYALQDNIAGNINTAVGISALRHTTGSHNIGIGWFAGGNATTGSDNIYIGHSGVAGEGATIRIGDGSQTRTFVAGIAGVNVGAQPAVLVNISGQLGVNTSSRRFKQDIHDMGEASATLLRLRSVSFRYKQPAADGSTPLQYGLIAEEVAEVYPELVALDAAGQPMTVLYHVLPALLLNELQRQHRTIEAQQAKIRAHEAELQALATRLAELAARLEPRAELAASR